MKKFPTSLLYAIAIFALIPFALRNMVALHFSETAAMRLWHNLFPAYWAILASIVFIGIVLSLIKIIFIVRDTRKGS